LNEKEKSEEVGKENFKRIQAMKDWKMLTGSLSEISDRREGVLV